MRPLVIALALALGATPAAAGEVRIFGTLGVGAGGMRAIGSVGTTPIPPLRPPLSRAGPAVTGKLDRGASKPRDGDGEGPPDRPHRRVFPLFHDHDDDERIIVVTLPPPPPAPPEPETAEPPPPPDPRGPAIMRVRGAAPAERYTIGEPLPAGVPFVTLHWRQYGLPEPPTGLSYARVGRDVLLLDPASRVVERRLEPAELREMQG